MPAFFIAVTALVLFIHPTYAALGGPLHGAVLLLGMLAVALYRPTALALLFAAGSAVVLVYLRNAVGGTFELDLPIGGLTVEGLPIELAGSTLTRIGSVLGLVFAGAGFWNARRLVVAAPWRAAAWTGWGVAVPLVVLFSLWLAYRQSRPRPGPRACSGGAGGGVRGRRRVAGAGRRAAACRGAGGLLRARRGRGGAAAWPAHGLSARA